MTAILVNPDGTMSTIDLSGPDDGLAAMQGAVGGYIEAVPVPTKPPMILWANEDGRALHLEINSWASMFMAEPIVGPVILTGGPDGHGGVLDVPEIFRLIILENWIPGSDPL